MTWKSKDILGSHYGLCRKPLSYAWLQHSFIPILGRQTHDQINGVSDGFVQELGYGFCIPNHPNLIEISMIRYDKALHYHGLSGLSGFEVAIFSTRCSSWFKLSVDRPHRPHRHIAAPRGAISGWRKSLGWRVDSPWIHRTVSGRHDLILWFWLDIECFGIFSDFLIFV